MFIYFEVASAVWQHFLTSYEVKVQSFSIVFGSLGYENLSRFCIKKPGKNHGNHENFQKTMDIKLLDMIE